MITPLFTTGTVIVNKEEYEVALIANTVKVTCGGSHFSIELPYKEDGSVDFYILSTSYVMDNLKLVSSTMAFLEFNKQNLVANLPFVFETHFKKKVEEFSNIEMATYKTVQNIIEKENSYSQLESHLKAFQYMGEMFLDLELLTDKLITSILHKSMIPTNVLDGIISVIFEGLKQLTNKAPLNTEFVSSLDADQQREIYIRLLKKGLNVDEAEKMMNGRICDLEKVIETESLVIGGC